MFQRLSLLVLAPLFAVGCSSVQKSASAPPAVSNSPATAAAAAAAKEAEAKKQESQLPHLKCVRGKDERLVEIEKQPKGCAVWYTKNGQRNSIASSTKGTKHCEDVEAHIQKNLEDAKYTCSK